MSTPSGTTADFDVSVLVWNVWNLPSWLTDNKSKTRAKQISPLLNNYDVVVLNEAFVNHASLLGEIVHKHRYIPPKRPWWTIFASGLMFLSKFEILEADCEAFHRRSGVDFFAAKSIARVTLRISRDGRDLGKLCIFGTHMQASHGSGAQKARKSQALQASSKIRRYEAEVNEPDIPILFVGDFNMGPYLGQDRPYSQHYNDEEDHRARTSAYQDILSLSALRDVDQFLIPARDQDEYEREICRILGNSGALKRHAFSYELQEYTDGGNRLSDTKALCMRLALGQ